MADEDLDQLDGKGLRAKLEEALRENANLRKVAAVSKADEVIRTGKLSLVEPQDLEGVSLDSIEEKAKQLQKEREGLISKYLSAQGIEAPDLAGSAEADADADARARARGLSFIGGEPPKLGNHEKLHGSDAIRAALEDAEKRRKK